MRKKSPTNTLSLIIPSYKQEKTILKDIARVKKTMQSLKIPYEIIVVIDGALDKTENVLKKRHFSFVNVVGYVHNHGKGYAIRFGMANATGKYIAFLDAGMDLNPEGLGLLLSVMKERNADVVIGSKLHPLSKVTYPWQRKILSYGYRLVVKSLFGLSISDTQVGIKIFKRNVLEDVLPRLLVKRYAFDIEILSVAYHLGYKKIYEAPVELTFTNWSSITSKNFIQLVAKMFWDTLAVFYRLRITKYYDNTSRRKWRYDPELNFRVNVG